VDALSEISTALEPEELEARLESLTIEIQQLGAEASALLFQSGSTAGADYKARFAQGVENARKLRGYSAEDEAMFAQGMLPRSIGMGGETAYDKGRGGGDFEETTDEWYQALNTEMQAVQRFSKEQQAQLDEITQSLAAKEAQVAGVVQGLYAQIDIYSDAVAGATSEAELGAAIGHLEQLEAIIQSLESGYTDVAAAKADLAAKTSILVETADDEARAAEEAYYKTAEGRVALAGQIESAKAAVRAQLDAAKTKNRVIVEEERRLTKETEAEGRLRLEQEKAVTRAAIEEARLKREAQVEEEKRLTKETELEARVRLESEKAAAKLAQEEARKARMLAVEQEKQKTIALKAAATEQARVARLTDQARKLTSDLGLEWARVEGAIQSQNLELDDAVDYLREMQRQAAQAEDEFNGIGGAIGGFLQKLDDASRRVEGFRRLGDDMQNIGASLQQAGAVVTGGLAVAGRDYVTFLEETGRGARALELTRDLTAGLREETLRLANTEGLDAQMLAQSVTVWAQAMGQSATSMEDVQNTVRQTVPILQLAVQEQANMEMATEAVAASLNQFDLRVEDTGRVVAILKKVADDAIGGIDGVTEAFKYAAPQAGRMGITIENLAGMVAILGQVGITGSQAGTSLDQMFRDFLNQTARGEETLQALFGTTSPFYNAEGVFVGAAQSIAMLERALSGLSEEQRNTAINTLFDANAQRAVSTLLDAQTEARRRASNAITEQAQVLDGALGEWQSKQQAFEDDEFRRVQRLESRWQTFWLTLGSQAVDLVIPALDKAAGTVERLIALAEANPAITKTIAAIGAGAVTAGTLANVAGSVMKGWSLALTAMGLLKSSQTAEQVATAQFAAAVQQFSVAVGAKSAVGGGAAAAGGAGIAGVLGAAAAGVTSVLGGVGLGGVAFEKLAGTDLGQSLGMQEGTSGKLLSSMAYALGSMFGKGEEWFNKVGQWTGVIEKAETAIIETSAATGDLDGELDDLYNNFNNLPDALPTPEELERPFAGIKLTAEQLDNAAKLYRDYLQDVADVNADFQRDLGDAARDLNSDLAKLATDYGAKRAEAERDFYAEQGQAAADFQKEQAQRAQEHARAMARMEEDHNARVADLVRERDALGLYEERESYARDKARAEDDFSFSEGQSAAEFQAEQARRAEEHAVRMVEMEQEYADARLRRRQEYEARVVALREEHAQELAILKQEYFDKLNAELNYYTASAEQQAAWQARMLAQAEGFLKSNAGLWNNYMAALPTPGGSRAGSGVGQYDYYQSGGLVDSTGLAMVHAGEYVLNPQTTAALQREVGTLTQGGVLAAAGGTQINIQSSPVFQNVGAGDRAWIQAELGRRDAQLIRQVAEALHG